MEVNFHLPGLRGNFPLNMLLINMLEEYPDYFRPGIKIASVFGEFPVSLWGGGRFNPTDQCDRKYVTTIISLLNKKGIPVRFTYTNPTVTKEELSDEYCNFCMEAGHNGLNEVLVVSPILEEYIREKYPKYRIDSSTCKGITSVEGINEELAKDYHLVVLDYNMNNHFDQIDKVSDKTRCEILVNACCVPECPRRREHYEIIGKNNRTLLENRKNNPSDPKKNIIEWYCSYGENAMPSVTRAYKTHVSPDSIWNDYVPMGFTQFKLEGRTANIFLMVNTYAYYFAKPEYRDDVEIMLLANLQANKVISVAKPRPAF
ncbi:MAG: hypothetical protein J5825_05105 [Lachnospiraceae bacterium]|nr:hypothetical protein [Lachnospiraceae bacterium]